jgi:hypothetical protein
MKDDECERRKYKGENICEYDGIFRFEGEDEGRRPVLQPFIRWASH